MPTANQYDLISKNPHSTVVAEYLPQANAATHYQSEAELERAFLQQLSKQGYETLNITSEKQLIQNLRSQLEATNDIQFTESEWKLFFNNEIANPNQSIPEKTRTIQEDHIKNLRREDGSTKNIYLLQKDNIHDNTLQVINQYATADGQRPNRYDVTVLVNGIPLVHIELKRRGVAIKEAFNQINRYQRESFWAASGLFEYVQLFVISNGTNTKYYSNTVRLQQLEHPRYHRVSQGKRASHSFEFTSWWADATNKAIPDLLDFTKTFFSKHTLLNILTRYCVFTAEEQLLAMRPYQIVATEKILNKIKCSTNYKKMGSVAAGGYVWHTTGSGKTLTSFKVAQLVNKLPGIEKVLFVVDRKDLDYQTIREYDKFEKGAADSNTSTAILKRQLADANSRIIITTIQKLSLFVARTAKHAIFDRHVVLIFDECHRSQFGEMHTAITKAFKKYHIFGFTGTPIFAVNASAGGQPDLRTTEQAFGSKLHTYTILDAIKDKNVLPFLVDFVGTAKTANNVKEKDVLDIDRQEALAAPARLQKIVTYILDHFDQKTKRNSHYRLNERRQAGFNSIFAVSSIAVAMKYYSEFKKQLQHAPSDKQLKIALIYSFGVNEDAGAGSDATSHGMIDENSDDTSGLDQSSRDFLDGALVDYNQMFATSYDTSADKFPNYYKDISKRVRNRDIDLLIVVNMFLTGFDATTLNTLWIDKKLRLHGLLQAYSRTNRILNSVKTYGNIVCFRNLEDATNESIALFGNENARGIVMLRSYDDYYYGYTEDDKKIHGYKSLVEELLEKFPIGEAITGEEKQREFIKLYSSILRMRNLLNAFDDFEGNQILSERDTQDYQSTYIDLYNEFRKREYGGDLENINDDIVFEMELIKQIEVNIDYILELVKKYHKDHIQNKEVLTDIQKAIASSPELRKKKELINQFIESLQVDSVGDSVVDEAVDEAWEKFVKLKKEEELKRMIKRERLHEMETYKFAESIFRDGHIPTAGTAIAEIVPKMSRFSASGERSKTLERVLHQFTDFFDRFSDIT